MLRPFHWRPGRVNAGFTCISRPHAAGKVVEIACLKIGGNALISLWASKRIVVTGGAGVETGLDAARKECARHKKADGNKPKCQACVQQQVEKKLMLGIIVCFAECGDQESREAAGR